MRMKLLFSMATILAAGLISPTAHAAPPALSIARTADDPADSLYRAARAALSDGDYRKAAALFQRVSESFPKSTYVESALYYQAFALYRNGEGADLHTALLTLQQLSARYPKSATLHDAATLRTRICGALARQGNASCAADISVQAESASVNCPSENDDNDVRIAALNGLMQMDGARALPILRKVLARRDACSIGLRRKALFLVAQKDDPDVVDILLSSARDDPNHDVREQAIFWLSQSRSARAAELLDSILVHSDDQGLREKALFALAQQSGGDGVAKIREFAARDDIPPELREKAVFWLGQTDGSANTTFLQQLFGRVTDQNLKEKILFALSQKRESSDWLIHVATDDHETTEIRKKAIFWAAQGGIPLSQLIGLYNRVSDHDLREQLIFAYSQRGEPAAFDELVSIAKTDKDPEARKKAVFWIGQSSDPRAAQVLQELIDK